MLMQARLFVGRGRLHWYDFTFIALAAVIVYPDEILDWIGARTGQHFTWIHVLFLETVVIGALALLDWYLLPIYSNLPWWKPLLFIALLGAFRAIWSMIESSFGD